MRRRGRGGRRGGAWERGWVGNGARIWGRGAAGQSWWRVGVSSKWGRRGGGAGRAGGKAEILKGGNAETERSREGGEGSEGLRAAERTARGSVLAKQGRTDADFQNLLQGRVGRGALEFPKHGVTPPACVRDVGKGVARCGEKQGDEQGEEAAEHVRGIRNARLD